VIALKDIRKYCAIFSRIGVDYNSMAEFDEKDGEMERL